MNNPFDFNAAVGLKPLGSAPFFIAEWPAPANVRTLITTRNGGISEGAYRSLNLGSHVGDNAGHVQHNR